MLGIFDDPDAQVDRLIEGMCPYHGTELALCSLEPDKQGGYCSKCEIVYVYRTDARGPLVEQHFTTTAT